MSRVSLIEQLYTEKKSVLEFNYDTLSAPSIYSLFTQQDINELARVATSLRYSANIDKKYELIDAIMNRRGFRKAHAGTNRVVYNCLEDIRFVAKVAIDKVGMRDTPAEFNNQNFFKPFCCKVFEVDQSGVIGFVERVNPITSIEEFASVGEDIFNMLVGKIIGKYVLDDIGATKYMNYGLRNNGFGPVILDFPYAYELDGNKMICRNMVDTPHGKITCGGEIDYDESFDHLVCSKCGKTYKARELENDKKIKLIMNDERGSDIMATRSRIMIDGKVYKDSMLTTKTYITKEQFSSTRTNGVDLNQDTFVVDGTINLRSKSKKQKMKDHYNSILIDNYNNKTTATPAKIDMIPKKDKSKEESIKDEKIERESLHGINNITYGEEEITGIEYVIVHDSNNEIKEEKIKIDDSTPVLVEEKKVESVIEDEIIEEPISETIKESIKNDKPNEEGNDILEEILESASNVKETLSKPDITVTINKVSSEDTKPKEKKNAPITQELVDEIITSMHDDKTGKENKSTVEYNISNDALDDYEENDMDDAMEFSTYVNQAKAVRRDKKKRKDKHFKSDDDMSEF